MSLWIEAACCCRRGKIRQNNEDNLCFAGQFLAKEHSDQDAALTYQGSVRAGLCFAVFDGMGGENFGEEASWAAARAMQKEPLHSMDRLNPEKYLQRLSTVCNLAVVKKAKQLKTDRMGTTMAALYLTQYSYWVCNLGDSRIYCLHDGKLIQLSVDHADPAMAGKGRKAPLTQHLGIDPQLMLLEPSIRKERLYKEDQILLCSDGLTDMVAEDRICDIMRNEKNIKNCVCALADQAMANGGRDNITAVSCRLYSKDGG